MLNFILLNRAAAAYSVDSIADEEDPPASEYLPVSNDDPEYNMRHERRGLAVIFNFVTFVRTVVHLL